MQSIIRCFQTFALLLAVSFMVSCAGNGNGAAARLDSAEALVQSFPDSALTVLRSIDTLTLTKRSLRARYSLLHAMALDKNWIDTTDVNIVMPAVDYYSSHGSADRRAKAYYYLGRVQENGGDLTGAAVSYTIAEDGLSGDDGFRGLIDMALANVYRKTHNVDKTLEYTEKARFFFTAANDTAHLRLIDGRLAMAYHERHEWSIADSIYQASLRKASCDTVYALLYMSQYAAMKVIQPEPDPEGAIDLLRLKKVDYGEALTVKDYGVYALASAQVADYQTCDAILSMIADLPAIRQKEARYFIYRISELRKDYKAALDILKSIYSDQDVMVSDILNQSVSVALQDHYERQAAEAVSRMKNNRLAWALLLTVITATFCVVASWISLRRRKEKEAVENLLRMSEDANRLLNQSNEALESDIGKLRSSFVMFFRQALEKMGSLSEAFIRTKDRSDESRKEAVYRRVERIVDDINKDDESFDRFETQVNMYLDNIIDHLIGDLQNSGSKVSRNDERFICYTIVGFDSNTISMLLGLSLSNVYTKRSRLRERIRQLDSPYKELYLKYFQA